MASIILPVRVTRRLRGPADKHAGALCRPAFICQHKQSNRDDTFLKAAGADSVLEVELRNGGGERN